MKKNILNIKYLYYLFLFLITLSVINTYAADFRTVKRVVDGDTIVLENGERVKLIGVDTPETVHPNKPVQYFGKEASAFTKKWLKVKK